ncbi:MAG: hypothetical protein JWM12_3753, partial [Ilumatobacteraceae bacterium]|nr:hypothetical protein [Ilumatobacteraceae bacterium]
PVRQGEPRRVRGQGEAANEVCLTARARSA